MKYISFFFIFSLVFSDHAMENNKQRRDCCYLAGLIKNIACNAPGALAYSTIEYSANVTLNTLTKLQNILQLPEETKQKFE